MTTPADDLIPEGFDRWPRKIQHRFVKELHALYFPEDAPAAGSALTAAIPQPGDSITVDAEIVGD